MPKPRVISKTIGQVTELTLIAKLKRGSAPKFKKILAQAQEVPNGALFAKLPSIHFARWVIFDNDTRLLFTSNFDGSFFTYIHDFSVEAPDAMDRVFNCCVGYPKKGCRDFDAFKRFILDHQVPTNLFYPAYPEASVVAVRKALVVKKLTDNFVKALESVRNASAVKKLTDNFVKALE
ncbi:MAG: hypothetical protein RLZZ15_2978 [Verrucomicrobiota bacterium]